jgi:hypothetical protein
MWDRQTFKRHIVSPNGKKIVVAFKKEGTFNNCTNLYYTLHIQWNLFSNSYYINTSIQFKMKYGHSTTAIKYRSVAVK